MITRKKLHVEVCEGPSKMDLFLSLATCMAKKPNQPVKVSFKVAPGQQLEKDGGPGDDYRYLATIRALEHEDGSGNSFCIKGTLIDNGNGRWKGEVKYPFTGYFHASPRKGYVEFTKDFADDK